MNNLSIPNILMYSILNVYFLNSSKWTYINSRPSPIYTLEMLYLAKQVLLKPKIVLLTTIVTLLGFYNNNSFKVILSNFCSFTHLAYKTWSLLLFSKNVITLPNLSLYCNTFYIFTVFRKALNKKGSWCQRLVIKIR